MTERLAVEDVEEDDHARPSERRIRLTTLDQVQAEMERVYRDMRAGKIQTSDGTKFIYALQTIAQVRALNNEHRLAALERAVRAAGMIEGKG